MSSYWRNLAWPLIALLALGACAQYSLISVERIEIAGAYSVSPSIKWNSKRGRDYELWTVDGPKLQDLTIYGGFEDDDILFSTMAKHPKLMERPIAVTGRRAVLGRPPEKVLDLLK